MISAFRSDGESIVNTLKSIDGQPAGVAFETPVGGKNNPTGVKASEHTQMGVDGQGILDLVGGGSMGKFSRGNLEFAEGISKVKDVIEVVGNESNGLSVERSTSNSERISLKVKFDTIQIESKYSNKFDSKNLKPIPTGNIFHIRNPEGDTIKTYRNFGL